MLRNLTKNFSFCNGAKCAAAELLHFEADHHGGRVLLALMGVLDGLTDGVGLPTRESAWVLSDIAAVFIGVELGKDAR